MSTFVAVCYPDQHRAHEVRLELQKLQADYLLDIDDAVVAVKDENGKLKLHQAFNMTAYGAASGGLWGSLVGLLFLNPLLGLGLGAAAGAVSGALTDIGISDELVKSIGEQLKPNTSALFALVRNETPDKVVEKIKEYGGTVLRSNLTHADEAKLQAALDEVKSRASAEAPAQ